MIIATKTTTKTNDVADFIVSSISNQLKLDKQVLLFVAGGSVISVAVKVSELLKNNLHHNLIQNLTITLTDERYGKVNHIDSNWHQLMEKSFSLPQAKFVPVLTGDDYKTTIAKFNMALEQEFKRAKYKIGLFGIGKDGHTAGILPNSVAIECKDLVCGYDTLVFSRITITPNAIKQLDEAVVFAQGEEKWSVLENLINENIDIMKQPTQVLKKVPLLTIFSDYKSSQ